LSPERWLRVRTVSVTIMCDRLDWSLRPVEATARLELPCLMSVLACDDVWMSSEVRSLTYMPTSGSRITSYFFFELSAFGSLSRSRMFSL